MGWAGAVVAFAIILGGCAANRIDEAADAVSERDGRDGGTPIVASQDDVSAKAEPATTTPAPAPSVGWIVTAATDGDTIAVGGPNGESATVRLIGINAPEGGECMAREAADAVLFLTSGQQLALVADVSDTDQYDRLLRYVEVVGGGDVGETLVALGLAIANRYEPDIARAAIYEERQAAAQAAGIGVWAPDACGPGVDGVAISIEVNADAEGNDHLNLNDEWVRLTNAGAAAVDLGGWIVADESSTHRYVFDDLVLEPSASVTLFTGCGIDDAAQRYWCNADSAVWNNDGDTVFLRDPSGNNVVVTPYAGP